jgi:hypothetical protein
VEAGRHRSPLLVEVRDTAEADPARFPSQRIVADAVILAALPHGEDQSLCIIQGQDDERTRLWSLILISHIRALRTAGIGREEDAAAVVSEWITVGLSVAKAIRNGWDDAANAKALFGEVTVREE